MESLELKKKRLLRELEATKSGTLGNPIIRLVLSIGFWALLMGPLMYLINYHDQGWQFSWLGLLKSVGYYSVAGILFDVLYFRIGYPFLIRYQEKKLAKVEEEILLKNQNSETPT